jgi:hypothetical protein
MAYNTTNTKLFLFVDMFLLTIFCYLHWICKVLIIVLNEISYSTFSYLSHKYLIAIENKIVKIQNKVMKGCIAIIDRSLHAFERDHNAQDNFFNNLKHPNYNGWKFCYCKKSLYFFCLNKTIYWYTIDCLKSWHDRCIFYATHFFINSLLILGWVERFKKKGKNIFNDLQYKNF